MTGKGALVPVAEGRPSPEAIEAAAQVLARDLHAHLLDGLAAGRLAALLAVGRQAEHLAALVGPAVAGRAFLAACQEPPVGG